MGWDGKCSYIYKCDGCGLERRDYATQDGSGRIAELHARWAEKVCECGGGFRLCNSEVQYWDGTGTVHTDIAKYFNPASTAYYDALFSRLRHPNATVRERALVEIARFFIHGRPKAMDDT